ncbi:uncharacterized mitochondrial protein AtMg00810-like [Lycium ferocissimum]|uniref:uncharacterized mitochondrial protein AtMg00810-like n=1 Tax=Lycium ferocissimum TaxID=112874 RepID=UPI0028162974|nr:uncharacterized mitochondrial protein AtMg00810-like [Lycium ferocissimum]
MKDLGELKFFLGIEFTSSENGIHLCQRKYALELVSELGLTDCNPSNTPLEFNHKLTSVEYDILFQPEVAEHDALLPDKGSYQRIVGRLLYLTMTRTDLAFVVQVLSQHMHAPKISHMETAKRVVRYIKGTAGLGLFMPLDGDMKVTAYYDSDWGSCVETKKSVTGYVMKFGGALISWKSKKQQNSFQELRRKISNLEVWPHQVEITWLNGLFKELSLSLRLPITLFCDSKAAI